MKKVLVGFVCLSWGVVLNAQIKDTTLKVIEIKAEKQITEIQKLGELHGTYIISGKKNDVIQVADINANVTEKTARQIFAKVPGIFAYDMDGSGNQVNIANRGLDPHRSWEYNIRQNGIMTNSDIYGYPASHYSPPMEAIRKIEMIKGSASLQYGAQFGGLINYVTKQGDTTKPLSLEGIQSIGSYGLLSSYNAIGGKIGKFSYYAYYQKRVSKGYRRNAESDANAQFVGLTYDFNKNVSLHAELGRSTYLFRIPGPLTDSMFYADSRQSTRNRNYFSPDIYVPSVSLNWQISPRTQLVFTQSAVLGTRSSVQFIGFANVADVIDPATGQYKARQVDIDQFNSYTTELRVAHQYSLGKMKGAVSGGLMLNNNNLHRRQQGKGTTGSDYDLTLTDPKWGRDLNYITKNLALFVENVIYLTPKLSISPGVRVENGITDMKGYISYLASDKVPLSIKHSFPLFGVSTQYRFNSDLRLYGSWSQAYRPMIFSDVIPTTSIEKTDENLKDAYGDTWELGINGVLMGKLYFDVTGFSMLYKNRIGSLILTDNNNQSYVYKTNTGTSRTNGIELYTEYKALTKENNSDFGLSVFTATSFFDAYYTKGSMVLNNKNENIVGNRLETVPRWISRNGVHFGYKKFSSTLQYSYTSDSYSDALNTVTPSSNGAKGLVPSYSVWDFNAAYRLNSQFTLKCGINNFTNEQYFTKRPTGYPGQGVWSSDGRSVVATIVFKI